MFFVAATAQVGSAKEGFYIGGEYIFNIIGGDVDGVDNGIGPGLILGYAFTPAFAFQLNFNATGHEADGDDAGLGAFILGLKYNFLSDQEFQPFIRAGYGGYALIIETTGGDTEFTGNGFDVGVGADYYVNPNLSIGLGVTRRLIRFKEVDSPNPLLDGDLDPELKGDTTSINLNFAWHF